MAVFVQIFDGTRMCCNLEDVEFSFGSLVNKICEKTRYPEQDLQLYYNGRLVQESERLQENGTYHVTLSLPGGKGGFGAMLRMIGAQIEKTTNREACRDLSGRRMRDVNNEKELQSWIEKKKLQEEEREKRRQAKLERMRSTPKHYFVDPNYDKQREDVTESLEEAVSAGISGSGTNGASSSGAIKRKADTDSDDEDEEADVAELKKHCMWLGIDIDEEEEEDDMEAKKSRSQDERSEEDISKDTSTSITPATSSSSASPVEGDSGADPPTGVENPEITGEGSSSGSKSLLSSLPPPSMGTSASTILDVEPIKLEEYLSVEDLEEAGLDRLKSALMERGMKCGGTLKERAQRLFSVKGLEPSEIDPSLLAKPAKGKKGKRK